MPWITALKHLAFVLFADKKREERGGEEREREREMVGPENEIFLSFSGWPKQMREGLTAGWSVALHSLKSVALMDIFDLADGGQLRRQFYT